MVQLLLDHGADINTRGGRYGHALISAAWLGRAKLVAILLANGSEETYSSTMWGTALEAAAGNGHMEFVQMLRDHEA